MNPSKLVTLDHVNNFFSLNGRLDPVDYGTTLTRGLGIDNRDEFPPPEPLRTRMRSGTDYAEKYIQQELDEDFESPQRQTLDLPGGSTVNLSEFNEFENVEGLTTVTGEMPCSNDLDAERAQELYATYYSTNEVKYNPELPITGYRNKIINRVEGNQVVVIQGATGCGKTTQVPQYILDYHAATGRYCNIVVTQPRKIAAISVARRVCQERDWSMGTIVGYQVAMDNKISADTRLSFVTTGVLLQKLVNSRRMDMYTHVILDEVHERDQDTDFALLVVKKLLRTNSRQVKVILMSATIDALMFAKYFTIPGVGRPAPIIEIEGKSKEVTEHYLLELSGLGIPLPELDLSMPSIPEALYDIAVRLMFVFDKIEKSEQGSPNEAEFAQYRGAVLIFLPGYEQISKMIGKLEDLQHKMKLTVLPLHSTITVEEQTRVFQPPVPAFRKVIISTNIAESSITVPDIKYVIDFCLTKSLVSDPETNYTCLQLEWASKANCTQRKGRAGRVDTGRVYRMVPYKLYEEFNEFSIPEIKRCPLQQTILFTKKLNFGEPQALLALALEPPALTDIEKSVLSLKEVGALSIAVGGRFTPFDGDLTFVGRVMSILPLDVYISKLIILGYVFNCLEDCIIIAASLSLKSFFSRPFRKMLDAYKSRLAWAEGTFSDCFAYLHAYKMWKKHSLQGNFKSSTEVESNWARNSFVQIKRIREVDMLVKEIEKRLATVNIRVNYHKTNEGADDEIQILKIVIAGAFYPNYFIQDAIDEQDALREVNNNDLLSTVVLTGLPANQGLLYAYAIREMLWGCSTGMSLDFEERKAYVKFHELHSEEKTRISQAVYLAVKLRLLKVPLFLQLFNPTDAERKMIQLRAMKSQGTEKKLHSNRMSLQLTPEPVKQVELPSIKTLTIKIFISHVIDCGHFWARYYDQTYQNIMGMIGELINSNNGQNLRPVTGVVKPGMLLFAPYKEKPSHMTKVSYYRGRVEEVNEAGKQVLVFFIDYGNTEYVAMKDLRDIDKNAAFEVLTTPALAFECRLCEVKPAAALSSTGAWSKDATHYFTSKVSGQQLTARVYSVLQNVVRLELFLPDHSESINRDLIHRNYAEYAEESYMSKENYELRLKSEQLATAKIFESEDRSVWQYSMEDTVDLQNLTRTTQRVRLNGPFSPLEVKYQGLTRLGSFRSVGIDRDSVNSVSLNPEPQDPDSQMLVGCHVSLSPSGSSLAVRNTTLMPKIRGLPALLCLMFSPCAELRCDPDKTKYTGALCGLGYDPESGESLYPEHEIELVFNAVIDTDDIRLINVIRTGVSVVLDHDGDVAGISSHKLKSVHETLRKRLLELLCKPRNMCVPFPFSHKYHWQQIPDECILVPPDVKEISAPPLLPMHSAIVLLADKSLEEGMRKHVKELYAKALKPMKRGERMVEKCKLCSETLFSQHDLGLHLKSAKHKAKEDFLVD